VEPNKAKKSTNVVRTGLAAVAAVVALLLFWTCNDLQTAPLSHYVRSDLPMLDLELQFINLKREKIPPEKTKLGSPEKEEPAAKTPETATKEKGSTAKETDTTTQEPASGSQEETSTPEETATTEMCPELFGGDTKSGSTSTSAKDRGADCPKTATWRVKRHPIGYSLTFQEPDKFLSLFEGNTKVKELFQSKLFQGVFYDPLHSASVRAEDLNLEGAEGAFLAKLVKEALHAHAVLHYDVVHGKKGFVFSFVRSECSYLSKVLPIIGRVLARSGYRTAKLKEPVLEAKIGLQRIFLTQYDDRIYLSNGLEALFNVLESLSPPEADLPKMPLVLTVRGEAFVDKLLPVMVGRPAVSVQLGFGLSEDSLGILQFPAGKLARKLHPKIFKGVLAGIPHDVSAAVATSYYLSPTMTTEAWQQMASKGPDDDAAPEGPREAGFALLWDLTSEGDRLSNIGVVIANQTTPDEVDQFKHYFADPALTTECGGGTVFLAATSSALLARMRESCAGQSLSVLNWERGARTKEYETAQLLLFMNPGTAMRELFLAGGAKSGEEGEFEPEWKQQYEKAKEGMREDGEKVFRSLPIFAWSGNTAPTADVIQLKGITVKQGASR